MPHELKWFHSICNDTIHKTMCHHHILCIRGLSISLENVVYWITLHQLYTCTAKSQGTSDKHLLKILSKGLKIRIGYFFYTQIIDKTHSIPQTSHSGLNKVKYYNLSLLH